MGRYESENMVGDNESAYIVGSAPKVKRVTLLVDTDTNWTSADLTPAEARALAELLLRHADRAEGKTG